jgi:hypothetical protein
MEHSSRGGTADTALRQSEGSLRDIADCGSSEALIGTTLILMSGKSKAVDSESTQRPVVYVPRAAMDEDGYFGMWLMPMKIRAILDEAQWNSPSDPSYGFIQGAQGLDYHKSNKA